MYEIAPSETTVLAKSLADIASMLREMKESQQTTPKLLTQPSQSSPPRQVPPKHCGVCSCNSHYTDECPQLQEDNIIVSSHNYCDGPHQTANTNNNPKVGAIINKCVGTPTNNLNIATPSRLHYDWWKGLEDRQIVHERIVRLDGDEERVFRERTHRLGWRFMHDYLVRINVSMVREFCVNFS
ncbi:hypothetical protein PIB30_058581 [Stylosanthes scabra]|uniref:Uncharacterized protein n=1 Tax=Stylosanthes scabra TaxID=79078 RepID=A0ABU6SLA7_9FABA|nr:hypothetical protein [Stylosanthes scabra]